MSLKRRGYRVKKKFTSRVDDTEFTPRESFLHPAVPPPYKMSQYGCIAFHRSISEKHLKFAFLKLTARFGM